MTWRNWCVLPFLTFAVAAVQNVKGDDIIVSCPARADAVIANTGRVVMWKHALVDSYNSAVGPYGGSNVGSNGTVRAADTIVRHGGVIKGPANEHSPAGLSGIAMSPIARPLPLGAKVPGHLKLHWKPKPHIAPRRLYRFRHRFRLACRDSRVSRRLCKNLRHRPAQHWERRERSWQNARSAVYRHRRKPGSSSVERLADGSAVCAEVRSESRLGCVRLGGGGNGQARNPRCRPL